MKIDALIIEDDTELIGLLTEYCGRFDITLAAATTPSEGFRLLSANSYDIIILDGMLPEMDGLDVCKTIRQDSSIPIIMLTARGDEVDRVLGLETGADDYLTKPFSPRELIARLRAIVARSRGRIGDALLYPRLKIDLARRRVYVEDKLIDLTDMEYRCLVFLAEHPGVHMTRPQLLEALRGITIDIHTRSIDILVSRLRQKLQPVDCIHTARNEGYAFIPPPQTSETSQQSETAIDIDAIV